MHWSKDKRILHRIANAAKARQITEWRDLPGAVLEMGNGFNMNTDSETIEHLSEASRS